jgi:hypothetical protein
VLNNSSDQFGTSTSAALSTGPVAVADVSGATSSSGVSVLINGSGQLGTTTSSRRFKRDIRPLGSAADRLMALRPVTFHYKPQYIKGQPDPLEYGLIAEDVAQVIPNLVAYGLDGKPFTVRYQELPVLLLAQAQRQQARINSQQHEIDRLAKEVAALERHARR